MKNNSQITNKLKKNMIIKKSNQPKQPKKQTNLSNVSKPIKKCENLTNSHRPNKTKLFWEENIATKAIPNNEINFDVIIVGGGPAGSAAACYAADEGLKVLLLEKDNYPRDKVCGDAVGGKALKHLEELGILDALEKSPHFIFDSVIFSNTREEKVKVEIKDSEAKGYVYPRLNFDWIMFNEAKSRVENKGGFVIQNFRVNSLLIDDKDNERIIGIKGKNDSRSRFYMET